MEVDFVLTIYKRSETVFTTRDLSILFPQLPYPLLKRKLSYYASTGKILRLRRGIYAKENFDPLELVNKIYAPSYISLETVLKKDGIIFQEYDTIFCISYLTRKIKCAGYNISYKKIKDVILLNKKGIKKENNYFIASRERAFLDAVFLYKNYYFDNLNPIDWKEVFNLITIYENNIL